MKTPVEIKKGLLVCSEMSSCATACKACPYDAGCRKAHEEEDIVPGSAMMIDALAYIRQLEAAAPKWISVDEQLPEPNKDVLLIAHGWKSRTIYIGRLRRIEASMGFFGIESKASDWTIWGWSYLVTPTVLYWMPLPEPPKEE